MGALALLPLTAISAAIPNPANRVAAQPVGGTAPVSIDRWGTLGQMLGVTWYTEGLAIQRMSTFAWSVPGRVLVIRHGPTDRLRIDPKFADIVQRIEINPATGSFDILYSYEDGHTLKAKGHVEPDGTFVEDLTNPDGSVQRNRYVLDNDRKMRIIRQKPQGNGWAIISIATKVGETKEERQAKLDLERARREAAEAQKRAEEEAKQAEREAMRAEDEAQRQQEQAESDARRQQNWDALQNMQRQAQEMSRQSEINFQNTMNRLRQQEAQRQEEARQRAEEARQATERARQAQLAQQEAAAQRANDARLQAQIARQQAAEAEKQKAADAQAKLAAQQAQQRQQQLQAQANQQKQAQQQQQQAEAQRKQNEAARQKAAQAELVNWDEGITLCAEPKTGKGDWTCYGPLQTTWGVVGQQSGQIAISQACGTDYGNVRDLGRSSAYRVFGCGFGISPLPSMRSYPGQADPPSRFGVFIPGRTTYSCPRNQTNVCKRAN